MSFIVDSCGDTFEVTPSGTHREVVEGAPEGDVRPATGSEVAAFLASRESAWAVIVETLPMTRAILASAGLRNDSYESDVAIPAIAKAWRAYDPERGSWKGLVRRVLWHDILSATRRARIREFSLDGDYQDDGEREVPDVVYILDRLCEQDRSLLVLRFWFDLTLDEIAEVMGFVKSGAWLRVKRALEKAREVVDDEERRSDVRRYGRKR